MSPARWQIWSALLVVYVVWGSTYLAIKVAVRTLPPLLSGGARFLVAGLLLSAIVAATGRSLRVSRRELASAFAARCLAPHVRRRHRAGRGDADRLERRRHDRRLGSTPGRRLADDRTGARCDGNPAGGRRRPRRSGLIVVPSGSSGGSTAVGLALMVGATVSWSTGSFVSRRLSLPADPFVATVYEMLGGGIVLIAVGLAAGERTPPGRPRDVCPLLAWLYLVTAGSLVGFTAYAWLLRHVPISKVVTHQYVNPLVAIALGALLLDERLTATTLAGAAIVVTAVFVTVRHETRQRRRRCPRPSPRHVPASRCRVEARTLRSSVDLACALVARGTRAGRSASASPTGRPATPTTTAALGPRSANTSSSDAVASTAASGGCIATAMSSLSASGFLKTRSSSPRSWSDPTTSASDSAARSRTTGSCEIP